MTAIGGATGARFSLLPPENATGNYVKIVQRLPVRTDIDDLAGQACLLRPVGLLSLYLTSRIVEDPPHPVKARERARKQGIDFLGLAMIGVALGSFQVVADTDQRNDWFAARHIVVLSVVTVSLLVMFVFWELRQHNPVINLHLFRNRNFAVAAALMLSLGCVLYAAIVLIPQFLQLLMGYPAQRAGEVLSLGGLTVVILLSLVGFLVSRIDARYLIAFGFIVSGIALLRMTNIKPPDRLQDCDVVEGLSERRSRILVCSHQHDFRCRCAGGAEQPGIRHREPDAKPGRQYRHIRGRRKASVDTQQHARRTGGFTTRFNGRQPCCRI